MSRKPRPPTLTELVEQLSEVLLTEFPSTKAARLAVALVRECRSPEPDMPLWETVLEAAKATPAPKPGRGGKGKART